MKLWKYPRTYHLPNSPGASSDDKILASLDGFIQKDLVILEKMDGENCNMTKDVIFARSIDGREHQSRDYVKSLWGKIKHNIPNNIRISGENLYAKHSIYYTDLKDFFLVFGIWNNDICLNWDETKAFCDNIGLCTVNEISRYYINSLNEQQQFLYKIEKSVLANQEGVVVRPINSFNFIDYQNCVGKWVRHNHVQSNQHWMNQPIIVNKKENQNA